MWAAFPCPTSYALLLLHYYVLLCEQLALALRHTRYYYYITTYYCVSSLPLPYGIRITTITWLRTNVWAACPCLTSYALLLLHDYVLLCQQPALVLLYTRCYYYITTYYSVSSLPLPYGIRVTTITLLSTTVWAACPWPTAYVLLLLRTTVWAACSCPTAYALLLLNDYVRLCEQPALAVRYTRYYYYITTDYCVSSLPLPYGICVTTITWLRTTLWAASPCPTSYALLLLHDYVLLCEQLALDLRHTSYYYYITKYYSVSSLPLPYGIRVTTFTWLRTTVWAACTCPTTYVLGLGLGLGLRARAVGLVPIWCPFLEFASRNCVPKLNLDLARGLVPKLCPYVVPASRFWFPACPNFRDSCVPMTPRCPDFRGSCVPMTPRCPFLLRSLSLICSYFLLDACSQ